MKDLIKLFKGKTEVRVQAHQVAEFEAKGYKQKKETVKTAEKPNFKTEVKENGEV